MDHLALFSQLQLTIVMPGVRRPAVAQLTCVGSPLLRILAFLEKSNSLLSRLAVRQAGVRPRGSLCFHEGRLSKF